MFKTNLIKIIATSFFFSFNCLYLSEVKSQNSTLTEIGETGLLRVGITGSAIPFGYRDSNQELRGFCLDLIELIKEELKTKLNRKIITTHIFISDLANRFQIVQDNIVHLECGANSIREIDDYNVIFSDPFFVTGTQFLVARDKVQQLTENIDNTENIKIGVLRYSSTEEYVRNRFPEAQIYLFQGLNGSSLGVSAVKNKRIDAFADDGILLIGSATSLNISLTKDFILVPQTPITCEEYGLILPKDDLPWTQLVNLVINSNEEKNILGDWFFVTENINYNAPDCKR